jgi:hypothetical protein
VWATPARTVSALAITVVAGGPASLWARASAGTRRSANAKRRHAAGVGTRTMDTNPLSRADDVVFGLGARRAAFLSPILKRDRALMPRIAGRL